MALAFDVNLFADSLGLPFGLYPLLFSTDFHNAYWYLLDVLIEIMIQANYVFIKKQNKAQC